MNKTFNLSPLIFMIIFLISCEEKPTIPVLTTNTATEITTISAISGGVITNDGGASVISKGLCWSTSDNPTIKDNKTIETGESNSFTGHLTGLSPKTLYYVRAYATNRSGTGYGESVSFTTIGDTPASVAINVTNIAIDSAILKGNVNPNSLSTSVSFEWGTTIDYGSTIVATQSPVTGNTSVSISAKLTDLTPKTTYHFRIKAENSLGITYSSDMTFTTLGNIPAIISKIETDIQVNSVTLNGLVNPNYLPTSVTFEWGTSTDYGSSKAALENPITGNSNINVLVDISGLSPGTIYHYRISATNKLGTTISDDMTFTTLGKVPFILSQDATDIQINTVKLNGSINPNYLSTIVTFEWGISSDYGNTLNLTQSPIDGNTSVNLSVDLSALNPGTTYHFRISATNALGTTNGSDMTFSTDIADKESNSYNTVTIGNQVWMAENLRSTKYNDQTPIPLMEGINQWQSATGMAYSWYNNNAENKNVYGVLYNWYVVDQSQNGFKNVCPLGWHVPKKSEWTILFNYLSQNGFGFGGNNQAISKSLASTTGWDTGYSAGVVGYDQSKNNSSGFNGLPGGVRLFDGTFSLLGQWGGWWAQPDDYTLSYSPWYITITYDNSTVTTLGLRSTHGSSIRCLKN